MKNVHVSLRKNIIEEIADYIVDRNQHCDYSLTTVIFPNKRPKHFLIKYLSKKLKKSFFPPKVFSIDEFIDRIFSHIFPEFKSISTIESVYLLYEASKDSPLINDSAESIEILKSFENFYAFGIKILQAFEELYIEDVSSQKLKNYETLINLYGSLSRLYERFYNTLEEKRFATRAFKYKKISDLIEVGDLSNTSEILFCGFFGLTKSEKKLVDKLSGFFEKGEIKGEFSIWQYDLNSNEPFEPEITVFECPDRHGQVYKLNNILNESLINEDTVVVLPSEDLLFPLLRHGLKGLNEKQYNLSMGYPILRTPLWSFFEDLWQLLSSTLNEEAAVNLFPVSEYLNFVLHPYVKNIKFENDPTVTRIIFHCLEKYLTEQEGLTVSLNDIESNILDKAFEFQSEIAKHSTYSLKKHVKNIHDTLIVPFTRLETLRDFSEKCIKTLKYIYENSTAKFHPLFFPFYSTIIDNLRELSNSLIKDLSFSEISSYFSFLKNYLKNIHTPFEGIPIRGLQVLGFLETRNLRFKNVLFLDLNEEIFPPLYEDFILPFRVREALKLPTLEESQRLLEYYFKTLIMGAERVFLFYVKNEKRERSRFVEKLIWEREKNKKLTPKQCIYYEISLTAKKPEPIKKEYFHVEFLKEFVYTPSSIDAYLSCPLKFYYSHILGLQTKERQDIDSAEIGTTVHEIMAQFFRRFLDGRKVGIEDLDSNLIRSYTEQYFNIRYGSYITGSIFLIREQIIKRLKEVIDKYFREILSKSSLFILGVEEPLWFKFENLKISGRIDVIHRRDDKIFIIDYKTSGDEDNFKINLNKLSLAIKAYTERLNKGDSVYLTDFIERYISSIQLPLYVLGYSIEKNIPLNFLAGKYLLLGRGKLDSKFEFDPFGESESLESAIKAIEFFLKCLFSELLNPQVPFYPTKNFKDKCYYCDFITNCGTLWVKTRQ